MSLVGLACNESETKIRIAGGCGTGSTLGRCPEVIPSSEALLSETLAVFAPDQSSYESLSLSHSTPAPGNRKPSITRTSGKGFLDRQKILQSCYCATPRGASVQGSAFVGAYKEPRSQRSRSALRHTLSAHVEGHIVQNKLFRKKNSPSLTSLNVLPHERHRIWNVKSSTQRVCSIE